MAGHGAELAAITVEVKDVARLVAMMASAFPQLTHAGNADARALATWRTSAGLRLAAPSAIASFAMLLTINHVKAGFDRHARRLILLIGIASNKLAHHACGVGRGALQ